MFRPQTAKAPRPCPWLSVTARHWDHSWAYLGAAAAPPLLTRASWQPVDWPSTGSRCRPSTSTSASRYYLIYCYYPSRYH
ncbi:hypothetical protein BDW02DRAFT_571334 [Decorospora gaudefroyi]|uniref:Uncharacterized protein n=1 Tax=Decorospora gaudefroyi TaxID=184978 RepID=A0A6A5K7A1_9PLEO|nr:hypothetical protein BDW02DRAFT_571334 [Decorospora gaudefroyi]